jgi:hypothetical protein
LQIDKWCFVIPTAPAGSGWFCGRVRLEILLPYRGGEE